MTETSKQPTSGPLRDNSRPAALLILLLTAAVALAWSHVKLLSQDEMFVLQTDTVSSVRELIHIQRHYPISLDPLVFHLLAHACTRLLGPTALALRLPSIAGFLLMQLCIFLATRRLANPSAALIAMAFPAFTATLFYAPEARPYGLLLGFYALAFLAWQTATRDPHSDPTNTTVLPTGAPDQTNNTVISTGARSLVFRRHPERTLSEQRESKGESKDPRIPSAPPRTLPLTTLALAIALTLNTHYFGILLLIPLCLAELTRTLQRRRIDAPMLAAILLGMAGILFALPFEKAAGEFRKHYYNAGAISLRAISQAYRSLFVSYTTQPLAIQRLEDVLLVAFAAAIIVLCTRRLRTLAVPRPELVFLLALAALPLFGVTLAIFVTHSIEVRYVLSAIIAIAIFFALAVEPPLRRLSKPAVAALLILGILLAGLLRIRDEHTKTQQQLALLKIPPALKARLLALPDSRIYIQDMGHFEVDSYYEPDPAIRSRLTLLYSHPDELRYDLHDTASLTAEHMQHFTGFTIVPYAQLKATRGEHVLILYHSGWDWTDQALAADRAQITSLGPALDGDAVSVAFSHP